jgi:hypothetical protein
MIFPLLSASLQILGPTIALSKILFVVWFSSWRTWTLKPSPPLITSAPTASRSSPPPTLSSSNQRCQYASQVRPESGGGCFRHGHQWGGRRRFLSCAEDRTAWSLRRRSVRISPRRERRIGRGCVSPLSSLSRTVRLRYSISLRCSLQTVLIV